MSDPSPSDDSDFLHGQFSAKLEITREETAAEGLKMVRFIVVGNEFLVDSSVVAEDSKKERSLQLFFDFNGPSLSLSLQSHTCPLVCHVLTPRSPPFAFLAFVANRPSRSIDNIPPSPSIHIPSLSAFRASQRVFLSSREVIGVFEEME